MRTLISFTATPLRARAHTLYKVERSKSFRIVSTTTARDSTGAGKPKKGGASSASSKPPKPQPPPRRSESEISPLEVLTSAGLQQYHKAFTDFGIECLEDMIDPRILSDDELRDDIGMKDAQITLFRNATKAFVVSEYEDIDLPS